MGLGKTIQCVALIAHLLTKDVGGPFLIVAPLATLPNWVREFEKWLPSHPVIRYHGPAATRDAMLKGPLNSKLKRNPDFPFIVTSYEVAIRDQSKLERLSDFTVRIYFDAALCIVAFKLEPFVFLIECSALYSTVFDCRRGSSDQESSLHTLVIPQKVESGQSFIVDWVRDVFLCCSVLGLCQSNFAMRSLNGSFSYFIAFMFTERRSRTPSMSYGVCSTYVYPRGVCKEN